MSHSIKVVNLKLNKMYWIETQIELTRELWRIEIEFVVSKLGNFQVTFFISNIFQIVAWLLNLHINARKNSERALQSNFTVHGAIVFTNFTILNINQSILFALYWDRVVLYTHTIYTQNS